MTRMRSKAPWVFATMATCVGHLVLAAQAPIQMPIVPPKSAFDAASIKPSDGGSLSLRTWAGGLVAANFPLQELISLTYGFPGKRTEGVPNWVATERFDINGRAPAGSPDGQAWAMMRTLFAERFQFKAHLETRESSVYALVVARNDGRLGPALHVSDGCGTEETVSANAPSALKTGVRHACGIHSFFDRGSVAITGGRVPLSTLARNLEGSAGRVVIDRTGLTGTFDFDLRFAPLGMKGVDADLSNTTTNIFVALDEQLGLQLKSSEGPVTVLVIDNISHPTPD